MQQIADWLEKLGMSEYVQRFAKNDIDIAVLRHLTDQDLKEIGVSLGHRRQLLRAIGPHQSHVCRARAFTPLLTCSNSARAAMRQIPSAASSGCPVACRQAQWRGC